MRRPLNEKQSLSLTKQGLGTVFYMLRYFITNSSSATP